MTPPSKLPHSLHHRFISFFDNHPPQAFSNSLRRLLLEYMEKQVNTGFPPHFDNLLWSLSDLFDLLDEAAAHLEEPRAAKEKVV